MKKNKLVPYALIIGSIILLTLGFNSLKKEEPDINKVLIETMNNSFDLLPFKLSKEEKMKLVQNPKLLIEIAEKHLREENESSDLACYSLCWLQYSNCWEGLLYYERGSEDWINQVDKCFIDLSKCSKKCKKEVGISPGVIQ